jgi:hypothetical protein
MPKPPPTDVIKKLFDETQILPDHPRVWVMVTHCYLELFVHQLATHQCRNADRIEQSNRDYPHSVKIVLLHEKGIISDSESEALHWFRKIRNKAAHVVDFSISESDLTLFKGERAPGKAPGSNIALDDPNNFAYLCQQIVLWFWNMHVRQLAPIFFPENS